MRPRKPHPHAEAVRAYRPLAALLPEHWRAHTVAAPDGANLRVTDTGGEGPAVLLLHGAQVNGLSWLRTARALEAEYRLFMLDWRGHGESARVGDANLDAASLVADARAIVAHFGLGDGPCHLVGHSMGADLAGRFAAEQPFASCALVEPALQDYDAATLQPNEEPLPWMAAIFATLAALPLLSHEERLQRALALLPPGTPLYEEADYVAFVSGQAQFDPAYYGQIARLGYLFQEPAVIARIACPLSNAVDRVPDDARREPRARLIRLHHPLAARQTPPFPRLRPRHHVRSAGGIRGGITTVLGQSAELIPSTLTKPGARSLTPP